MTVQLDLFGNEVTEKPAPKFAPPDELEWATLDLGEAPEEVAHVRRMLGLEVDK
jgi:hypothetical protein